MIALCEQTALNSISPYLPDMASSFPEVDRSRVGINVGIIASTFALAQFATNFFWGWLSDRIGRKPVILVGTILTGGCFVAFGFCRTLWQAILVQALMGMVNGNQAVVATCLGEITDRSNQSKAFTYLPVLYSIGGISGPIVGGLLVSKTKPLIPGFPYLCPNLASAAILLVDFVLTMIFLDETLQDRVGLQNTARKVRKLFSWLKNLTPSSCPTHSSTGHTRSHGCQSDAVRQYYDSNSGDDSDSDSIADPSSALLFRNLDHHHELTRDDVLTKDTVLLLLTYLIFSLSNVSFNTLYPIFGQAPPPTGRNLTPEEIGLSQAFSGVVTIVFQVCIFGKLRDKMGNKWSYRAGLFGFAISFFLMPFVGYKDEAAEKGKLSKSLAILAIELCFVLLVKTVAAVGGLTSALLLVRSSFPFPHLGLHALKAVHSADKDRSPTQSQIPLSSGR
jgi:MFS family permease